MKLRSAIFYVKNINRSVSFYEKLGFKIVENYGKFISFKTDDEGVFLSLTEITGYKKEPGNQTCLFASDNVKGFFEKCKLMGAPIETQLEQTDFGLAFAVLDPDGNKLEFIEA